MDPSSLPLSEAVHHTTVHASHSWGGAVGASPSPRQAEAISTPDNASLPTSHFSSARLSGYTLKTTPMRKLKHKRLSDVEVDNIAMSTNHCEIFKIDKHFRIRDLSLNGTFIGRPGVRMSKNSMQRLKHKVQISFVNLTAADSNVPIKRLWV